MALSIVYLVEAQRNQTTIRKVKPMNSSIFRKILQIEIVLILGSSMYAKAQYNFVTFDAPGSPMVNVVGISGNTIIGNCFNNYRGFIYVYNGGCTVFDALDSYETYLTAIDGNNICGWGDAGNMDSFEYNGSDYISISQTDTIMGISGNKMIFFSMQNQDTYLLDGNNKTILTMPITGVIFTFAKGIDGNNIVGYYDQQQGPDIGFLYDGTNYTTISVPGFYDTIPTGISGGKIVGYCDYGRVSNYYGASQGFVYNGSTFTLFTVPGSISTQAAGISGNNIAGSYTDTNNIIHGFLAIPIQPKPCSLGILNMTNSELQITLTGTANYQYILQSSTSLVPPISWTITSTNLTDANGNSSITITNLPAAGSVFFRAISQ